MKPNVDGIIAGSFAARQSKTILALTAFLEL
jgi:hypothetical protein